jgi:hypothetical protein
MRVPGAGGCRWRTRATAVLLGVVLTASSAALPSAQAMATTWRPVDFTPASNPGAPVFPEHCRHSPDPAPRASELLANIYRLSSFPPVTLPEDLAWNENPLGDRTWEFQLHSLNFVRDLLAAGAATSTTAYRERALALLADWHRDNPRTGAPSPFSWGTHSTALRAVAYACAADTTPMTSWLREALVRHGKTLADPGFYVKVGNHGLNQSIGLLEIGRVLGRSDWIGLAGKRINEFVLASVDAQGVSNEQSTGYQAYTWARYMVARDRMLAVGLVPGSGFARVDLMPRFMAHATLPNGEYELIGDTERRAATRVPGTWAEFAATGGASGRKPSGTVARYGAGYLFARSGWGETRPFEDEVHLSLRWGPGRRMHGHPDGLALTLYGFGSRLLVDPGKHSYDKDAWRAFFTSRRAHNVVTVDGLAWDSAAPTRLLGHTTATRYTDTRLRTAGYRGVTHTRRVTFSRRMHYVLVEDRLVSAASRTYRQLWHLVEGSKPVLGTTAVVTQRTRGNVLIRQLAGSPTIRFKTGRTDPIQGWISYAHKQKVAAPVVEAIRKGSSVRYLTLIVPAGGTPHVRISGLRLTADGYRVTITIGSRSERVVASGTSVSVTSVD